MRWWDWFLAGIAVLTVVNAAVPASLVLLGRRNDARTLAAFIPDCIVLISRLARDPRVPRRRKLILVAYLALPLDLVPDFISVAGQLDDAIPRQLWPERGARRRACTTVQLRVSGSPGGLYSGFLPGPWDAGDACSAVLASAHGKCRLQPALEGDQRDRRPLLRGLG
jgi:hypothetical protein